jgi:glyoxylase I family protein
MFSGIHHASFTVSDMDRSIAFYRDVLGMELTWDSKVAGVQFKGPVSDAVTGCPGTEQRIAFLSLGESRIELVEFTPTGRPQTDNKPSDTGSAHICFRTDNMDEVYRRLQTHNVPLHCVPQDNGPAIVIYFRDPDGCILEATQPKAG